MVIGRSSLPVWVSVSNSNNSSSVPNPPGNATIARDRWANHNLRMKK